MKWKESGLRRPILYSSPDTHRREAKANINNWINNCTGSLGILQILIDKGANINAMNNNGHTALDAALNKANKIEGKFKS